MPALAETRSPKVLLSSFPGQFSIVNHCFIILNRLIPQMKKKTTFMLKILNLLGGCKYKIYKSQLDVML